VIERTIAAKASGLGADEYAKVLAGNQTLHGAIQFLLQFFGAGAIIAFCGPIAALTAAGMARFLSFLAFFSIQAQIFPNLTVWYSSHPVIPVTFVIITDLICRLTTQTISKPVRESLWVFIPKSNKYRSKIIVDVLAHRIGTSLAAFLANVQILWVLNNYIVSLEVTQTVYKIFNGNNDLKFTGFIGQDHIVWGILATILLCIFGVLLGNAFNNSTKKAKSE
jgi:ATP/ADP translocase